MPTSAGRQIALEVARVLGSAIGESGEFLAGPDRDSLAGGVQSIGRRICRAWARTPALSDQGRIAGFDTVCTPYLQSISEVPVPGAGTDLPGGQCPGVLYEIVGQEFGGIVFCNTGQQSNFNSPPNSILGRVYGPVQGVRYATVSTKTCAGATRQNQIARQVLCSGTEATGIQPFGWYTQSTFPPTPANEARRIEAYRTEISAFNVVGGGNPLACGQGYSNPTSAPGLPALPPTFPVETPFGDINTQINLLPDGRIELVLPDGTYEIDPFGPGGESGGGGGSPKSVFLPPSEAPVPVTPGDEIEPPEGRAIVAVRVGLPADYEGAGFRPFITEVVNRAYFPRCGYLVFRLPGGGLEGPYDVQLAGQVISCAFPGGATSAIYDSLDTSSGVVVELFTLPIEVGL